MSLEYNPGKENFSKPAKKFEVKQQIRAELDSYYNSIESEIEEEESDTEEYPLELDKDYKERIFTKDPVDIIEIPDFSEKHGYTIKARASDLVRLLQKEEVENFLTENEFNEISTYLNVSPNRPYHIPLLTPEDLSRKNQDEKKVVEEFLKSKYISLDINGLEVVEEENDAAQYYGLATFYPKGSEESFHIGPKEIRFLIATLHEGKREIEKVDLTKKFTTDELKNKTRNRAKNLVNSGKYETKIGAIRRALQETMPPEKYEQFATLAMLIGKKYGIEHFNRENISFSTNQVGWHSWYLTVPNDSYDKNYHSSVDNLDEERERWKLYPNMIIKITDHFTRYGQITNKKGDVLYKTYVISEDNKQVTLINNYLIDDTLYDYGYVSGKEEKVSFEDIEKILDK